MIRFKKGNIFNEPAEAIVNTVNCVGVMGKGLAFQFKQKYPDNFRAYAQACWDGQVKPGRMFTFKTYHPNIHSYIINFPTKRHWRNDSRIEDIQDGLAALAGEVRGRNILSIAIPPLGCGLGGLDWQKVRPLIKDSFDSLPEVEVIVFEPQ